MPVSIPSNERHPPTADAEGDTPKSPSVGGTTAVVEAVSRTATGAATDCGERETGDATAPAGKDSAFGDLFVEASVTLPSG